MVALMETIYPKSKFKCTTKSGLQYEGEVMGFNQEGNYVIIKSFNLKSGLFDIHLINLIDTSYEVVAPNKIDPVPFMNLEEVEKVHSKNIERHMLHYSIPKDAAPIAKSLYLEISKTLKVNWKGLELIVMDEVTIAPPYNVASCHGKAERIDYVKKVIEKHNERFTSQNI